MFPRPRYRSFEPLQTQQIRLRNLIKLSAINLNCDENDKTSMIYFTLHLSAFAKPIYTSEKVQLKNKIEWSEINCQQVFSSSQKFVVVRVWKHQLLQTKQNDDNVVISSRTDQLMFLWGVYFSSLIAISKHKELSFRENTLLFHIFDDVFSSPDQIVIPEIIICDQYLDTLSTSPLSIDSSILIKNQKSNGTTTISSSSPKSISTITTETSNITIGSNIGSIKDLKVKFRCQEFPRHDIQSSYSVSRLMMLQELQRKIKQKREESKILADRICMKSAACLNIDLIKRKPVIYETKTQSGMGKQLSRLLSQQRAPPKPETLLKIHELRKDIECKKFRINFLTLERDRLRLQNKMLEAKRERLKDENTENEAMIWNCMRTLSRDSLKTHQEKLFQQRELLTNNKLGLGETKRCLLKELNEIYRIQKNDKGLLCINNTHLPDAESYSSSSATASEISIALGYVSHTIIILARILDIPLKNQIIYEGSRSKIIDNIKILPPSDRIFPLFCRVLPPPNVLLYGVYLLNQNISQIKYQLGLSRGDLRATLANLWDLMNINKCETNMQFQDNLQTPRNNDCASSVDSVPLDMILNVRPMSIDSSPRVSRSLDDFEEVINNLQSKFNFSAPDLTSADQHIIKI